MKKKKIMLGILPKSAWLLLLIPTFLFLMLASARPAAAILTTPGPAVTPTSGSSSQNTNSSSNQNSATDQTSTSTSNNGVEPKQPPDACDTSKHPELKSDATAQASCACTDGTNPNLTQAEVDTCNTCKSGSQNDCLANNVIIKDLNTIIKFLSAAVGVVVVADIILGGIMFGTATEGSEQVKRAKDRITKGVTALIVFMFIFAFIQWIIPGGLFNT